MTLARLTGVKPLLATLSLVALAACSAPEPSTSPTGAPASASATPAATLTTTAAARDDRFALTVEIAKDRYAVGELIEVGTTFTFLGPEPQATASGSGSGLVVVALDQLDGPLDPGGGADSSCEAYELVRGVPNLVPYTKSGGWDATDPNAAWYTGFFADPALRLPVGTWRLTARLEASLEACSGDWHTLEAAVIFQVTD